MSTFYRPIKTFDLERDADELASRRINKSRSFAQIEVDEIHEDDVIDEMIADFKNIRFLGVIDVEEE